jgi:hypothetical protein
MTLFNVVIMFYVLWKLVCMRHNFVNTILYTMIRMHQSIKKFQIMQKEAEIAQKEAEISQKEADKNKVFQGDQIVKAVYIAEEAANAWIMLDNDTDNEHNTFLNWTRAIAGIHKAIKATAANEILVSKVDKALREANLIAISTQNKIKADKAFQDVLVSQNNVVIAQTLTLSSLVYWSWIVAFQIIIVMMFQMVIFPF